MKRFLLLALLIAAPALAATPRSYTDEMWQVRAEPKIGWAFKGLLSDGLTKLGQHIEVPYRLYSTGTDALLHVGASLISAGDGAGKTPAPVSGVAVLDFADTTVDFQSAAVLPLGNVLTDGGLFALPLVSVGRFVNCVFVTRSDGKVDTHFSPDVASLISLENVGTTLASLNGRPMGYVTLESTGASAFKTAGSVTSIIEMAVGGSPRVVRFAAGDALSSLLPAGTNGQILNYAGGTAAWTNTITTGKSIAGSADEVQLDIAGGPGQSLSILRVTQGADTLLTVDPSGATTTSVPGGVADVLTLNRPAFGTANFLVMKEGGSAVARFGNLGGTDVRLIMGGVSGYGTQISQQGQGFAEYIAAGYGGAFANTPPATLTLQRRRGTIPSPTTVLSGDHLGALKFYGFSSNDSEAAKIVAEVDGTPGSSDMPGRLTFWTTPDGSATPVERMRLSQDGALRVSALATGTLVSDGSGNVTSNASVTISSAGTIQETIANGNTYPSGSTAGITFGNRQAGSVEPFIAGTGTITNSGLRLIGRIATDSGSTGAVIIAGETTAGAALTVKDILQVRNTVGGSNLFTVNSDGAVTISETGGNGGNTPHHCVVRTATAAGDVSVSCSAGEMATGGGCEPIVGDIVACWPTDGSTSAPPTTWRAVNSGAGSTKAYAVCCDY